MAYPPCSGTLQNPFNNMSNDDDEFGDFTSAVTFPPTGNGFQFGAPIPIPNVVFFNSADDEFGDFCGSTQPAPQAPQSSVVTEPLARKCQPNYDIDLESDFKAVAQLPWSIVEEEFNCSSPLVVSSTDSPLQPIAAVAVCLEDEFGDFSQPAVVSPVEEELILPGFSEIINSDNPREDDEFGDFTDISSTALQQPTAQVEIDRVLATLFPVGKTDSNDHQVAASLQTGALWSYVSQLDATPALTFTWRHSAAQQKFLHALRIDSTVFQSGNAVHRWASPHSANSSVISDPVALDLDFFMNAASSPKPVRQHDQSSHQLADFFDQLDLEVASPSGARPIVDLLQ